MEKTKTRGKGKMVNVVIGYKGVELRLACENDDEEQWEETDTLVDGTSGVAGLYCNTFFGVNLEIQNTKNMEIGTSNRKYIYIYKISDIEDKLIRFEWVNEGTGEEYETPDFEAANIEKLYSGMIYFNGDVMVDIRKRKRLFRTNKEDLFITFIRK